MEKVMINKKEFVTRLRDGWILVDDRDYQVERRNNGGAYRVVYRRRGNFLETRSSYEDGYWERYHPYNEKIGINEAIEDLMSHVADTIGDKCHHYPQDDRWGWTRPGEW